ncbi:MAG: T9SS type A sorting domain-containing protein [Saprospiraceae bacterium]
MYPNPTSGHCNVSFKLNGHPKTQVKLTNLFGHVLESHEVIGSSMSLSLSGLPTGIYFVQITVNGKLLKTEKLMKY